MLPSILDIARQHALQMSERSTHSEKDVRFKCPWCQADDQRAGKYYLSLNVKDNVFQCWACGKSGGVLQFIAELEHTSVEQVKRRLWGKVKAPLLHPAERLTPNQLRAIGIVGQLGFIKKNSDPLYYQRTLNWIWQEWQTYVKKRKELAYIGILTLNDSEKIRQTCQKYAKEIGAKSGEFLRELVMVKFSKRKPDWAKAAEEFVESATASPDRLAGR
ncbi:hypothetical protein CEB3_c13780 [Peptococcaceae bacterium CEB3]|nr:hypothetical protein CEB3_c13780 [Peptococcaceae bacterium CEB3]